MLGQLAGKKQAHGGLDLPGGDGGTLVVVSQAGRLAGDALEDVVHEGVHDTHRLRGDTGVGVDLLQHLVDVDGVALLPGLSAFLSSLPCRLRHGLFRALLRGGLRWLRHSAPRRVRLKNEGEAASPHVI